MKQKGSALIYFLVKIIIALALISGAYFFGILKNNPQIQNPVVSQTPQPTTSPILSPDETANWKTYKNLSLNYELKYPDTWKVEEDQERINIVPPGTKYPFNIEIKGLDQNKEKMINDLIALNQKQEGTQIERNSNLHIGKLETLKIEHSAENLKAVDLFAFTDSQMIAVSFSYQTKDGERLQIINQILSTFRFD